MTMPPLDPNAYPPTLGDLLRRLPLGPAGAGHSGSRRAPGPGSDHGGVPACRAGLWLAFDFLDESHKISQDIDSPDGSFWHGIMHRREPDPSNSKYWWRRVGSHPVLDRLVQQSPLVGYAFTDPHAFVDFVERVRDTGTTDEEAAKRVQSWSGSCSSTTFHAGVSRVAH